MQHALFNLPHTFMSGPCRRMTVLIWFSCPQRTVTSGQCSVRKAVSRRPNMRSEWPSSTDRTWQKSITTCEYQIILKMFHTDSNLWFWLAFRWNISIKMKHFHKNETFSYKWNIFVKCSLKEVGENLIHLIWLVDSDVRSAWINYVSPAPRNGK